MFQNLYPYRAEKTEVLSEDLLQVSCSKDVCVCRKACLKALTELNSKDPNINNTVQAVVNKCL